MKHHETTGILAPKAPQTLLPPKKTLNKLKTYALILKASTLKQFQVLQRPTLPVKTLPQCLGHCRCSKKTSGQQSVRSKAFGAIKHCIIPTFYCVFLVCFNQFSIYLSCCSFRVVSSNFIQFPSDLSCFSIGFQSL